MVMAMNDKTTSQSKEIRKVVSGSFAGALLEWYDFFIYGMASGLLFGQLFFPDADPMIGMLGAFASFAVGFWARPIGGIVFGHFGDRFGRKATLLWTIMIVGISTVLIGCLPTYAQVGIWAPILLTVLRLIQGFGLGGEYAGAALMAIESAPKSRRGFIGSLPQAAASAGLVLATAVFALCNATLSNEQFITWGWRIPFLLSALLLLVGLYIRFNVKETSDFVRAAQPAPTTPCGDSSHRFPLITLLRTQKRNLLLAMGARLIETVMFNIVYAFAIVYMTQSLNMDRQLPLMALLCAAAIGIITCPVAGWLSDRYGQKSIYLFGAAFCVLFAFPFYFLLGTQNTTLVFIAMILGYNLGPTLIFAVQATMFSQIFDVRVRYTGLSVAYQVSAIAGGMTPVTAILLLMANDGQPWYVAIATAIIGIISFACVRLIHQGEPVNHKTTAPLALPLHVLQAK
ncbi:MHS family MFS transporter [Deefgea piscis]|uniref:MHS family MFS transporter n=2 Tax=Deefgea piscis TaxID=2739061 RepID=A0A6M8SV33_9NEIS|nr:MHS family MFS transporter [Deefgea piscis]